MATSGELAAALARQLGLPPSTMDTHLRNVRERGLITSAGRGPSAARMGIDDAAVLLLAALAAPQAKDSVEAATAGGLLPRAGAPSFEPAPGWTARVSPSAIRSALARAKAEATRSPLVQSASFGEALRTLLKMTAEAMAGERLAIFNGGKVSRPRAEVRVSRPGGQLCAEDGASVARATVRLFRGEVAELHTFGAVGCRARCGDLVEERLATSATLEALVDVLAG